jgi:hypothetical protein
MMRYKVLGVMVVLFIFMVPICFLATLNMIAPRPIPYNPVTYLIVSIVIIVIKIPVKP